MRFVHGLHKSGLRYTIAVVLVVAVLGALWYASEQLLPPADPRLGYSLVGKQGVVVPPSYSCDATRLRVGTISDLGRDELGVETKRLTGPGIEHLRVALTPATSIIEIRVPSFINEQLKQKLARGQDPVERVHVTRDKLFSGQVVNVVSATNICDKIQVQAESIEYKIVVNTTI